MISRFEQFCSSISCLHRYIQKIERVEMEKFGLKGPHVQCMLALSGNPEGLTSAQLCVLCDRDKAAISRTVAELEREEMVERVTNNGNRYRAILKLTDRGRAASAQVNERVKLAVEKAGEGLSDEQRSVLYSSLELIAENLQEISFSGLEEA